MYHNWKNFGDMSPQHGQTWISGDSSDDFADVVSVLCGSDVGLAENQYRLERGSIYLGGDWESAMDCVGFDTIGPPEFLEIAYMVNAYRGYDRDHCGGFDIVQIGKTLDDFTASGTTCDDATILHGNTSIAKYIEREWLA